MSLAFKKIGRPSIIKLTLSWQFFSKIKKNAGLRGKALKSLSLVIPIIVYMTIDRFWELLSKKTVAKSSSVETKELEEILLAHPEWKKRRHIVKS
jgi:hypothetical protein